MTDRPNNWTNKLTKQRRANRPTNQQTDMRVHRKVILHKYDRHNRTGENLEKKEFERKSKKTRFRSRKIVGFKKKERKHPFDWEKKKENTPRKKFNKFSHQVCSMSAYLPYSINPVRFFSLFTFVQSESTCFENWCWWLIA